MNSIRLVAIGQPETELLSALCGPLAAEFAVDCQIDTRRLDAQIAFHPERGQYHSSEMLAELLRVPHEGAHLLGVAAVDFYIPILTFVFGEAQTEGHCAVVSYHRLTQEFYGLPEDHDVLRERLIKEAVHELGHTLALHHCEDYECVMASSHSVEWIDLKGWRFCDNCRQAAREAAAEKGRPVPGIAAARR